MAEFTTGEAVALELPIARIPTRAAAFLVDVVLQLIIGWMLMFGIVAVLLPSDLDSAWLATAVLSTVIIVLVGYPVASETIGRGRTLGKLMFGLRVVRADGGPTDFRHALTRGLAGAIVDFWMLGGFGAIAMITSLCSPNARRVGDVLAGTVVVYSQQRLPIPALAVPPPWLADWATRQDPTALPDDLALAVRRYLTRIRTLTPAAQVELGNALADAVCTRLGIARPGNYPSPQILGSIMAERQRRALTAPITAPPAIGWAANSVAVR
ncbi:RDD family protein [Nocardia cyriacigeorgica]|uniref:RDD family protein n=1 Tax=Nocardia cyriacigeorgica TaxID=135487 RepID=A0ABX0CCD7_9NOCA|nr:RDD family protein [Nocardia cyriacigeorgica]NEW54229.1 RDD family protein [Nocardia cyriacigeorgica]